MIKKSIFEEELINNMHQQLIKQATQQNSDCLEEAIDCLNSAAEILDDIGMIKSSEDVLKVLLKIANKSLNAKINDRHTKNLSTNKMISNLKDHGTVFNMSNDHILDTTEINDSLKVDDSSSEINDFEDERD